MPEFIQNYNFNILYICLLLIMYNIWKSNYEYINIILSKLYLLNYIIYIYIYIIDEVRSITYYMYVCMYVIR